MTTTPTPRLVPDRPSDAEITCTLREIVRKRNRGKLTVKDLCDAVLAAADQIDASAPPAVAPEIFSERHSVDLRSIKVGEVLTQPQWDAVCAFVREQEAIIESAQLAAATAAPAEVAVVGERGSVSWRSDRILPVGAPLYAEPPAAPAEGDGWALAEKVRTALDKQACPDHFMRVAMESIVENYTAPRVTGGREVGDAAVRRARNAYDKAMREGDPLLEGTKNKAMKAALQAATGGASE